MIYRRALVYFLGVLALAGCNSSEKGTADATQSGQTQPMKIALITPGPVSDSGWNALAYDGLQKVKSELGATVDNQEAEGPKIKDAVRSYAQKGYKLIFGHGFEYNAPMVAVAKDFPDTVFISSSGGETAKNAGSFRFYLEQGCYLGGMLAAKMSKSHKLGMVTFAKIPSIESTLKAFAAGAKAADPNVQILPTVYFGSPTDIAAAKRATAQLISQGADVIVHQANAAAQGVFDACKAGNALAIGTNADQNSNPTGTVIGSAVIIAGPAFLDLAKEVQAGTYEGKIKLVGMENDAIDFVLNPAYSSQVPEDVKKLLDDTKEQIRTGKLVVPKDDF
jgi:basic membrane lipoprotein Med (substrate-binding protein (PBP1-ABC) superfamily)